MAMSVDERVRKAAKASSDSARRRRFLRYADEIEQAPDVPIVVQERLIAVLAELGWQITSPVDEQEGAATTQPSVK